MFTDILVRFTFLLLTVGVYVVMPAPLIVPKRQFTITFETSNEAYADTDAYIYLKIIMERRDSEWINIDDMWRNDFEKGNVDLFNITTDLYGPFRGFVLSMGSWDLYVNRSWKISMGSVTTVNDQSHQPIIQSIQCNFDTWFRLSSGEDYNTNLYCLKKGSYYPALLKRIDEGETESYRLFFSK